jgi:hypothetical protein
MKKVFLTMFAASAIILGTGCLKDKGYDDNKYGLNGIDNSPKTIGIPEASIKVNIRSVIPTTTPATVQMVQVNLNSNLAAPEDLHVNLVANPTLVANYNADPANTPKLVVLPLALYTSSPLKVTIPKGTNIGALVFTIPNPSLLNITLNYGFGYSIASIDEPGYTIADNQKDILCILNVKNEWDAKYDVTGYFFHPTAPRALNLEKRLGTGGPITCTAAVGDLGPQGFTMNFNVVTNTCTAWASTGSTPASPASSGFFTADNPGGIAYAPIAPGTGQWLQSTYNNTYNPTTKTFRMHYGYGAGSSSPAGWSRNVYEKWVRQ